jgi:hypothetical protein
MYKKMNTTKDILPKHPATILHDFINTLSANPDVDAPTSRDVHDTTNAAVNLINATWQNRMKARFMQCYSNSDPMGMSGTACDKIYFSDVVDEVCLQIRPRVSDKEIDRMYANRLKFMVIEKLKEAYVCQIEQPHFMLVFDDGEIVKNNGHAMVMKKGWGIMW